MKLQNQRIDLRVVQIKLLQSKEGGELPKPPGISAI